MISCQSNCSFFLITLPMKLNRGALLHCRGSVNLYTNCVYTVFCHLSSVNTMQTANQPKISMRYMTGTQLWALVSCMLVNWLTGTPKGSRAVVNDAFPAVRSKNSACCCCCIYYSFTESYIILHIQLSSSNNPINADRHIVGEIQAVIGHSTWNKVEWVYRLDSPTMFNPG